MLALLRRADVMQRRKQFRVVKKANPARRAMNKKLITIPQGTILYHGTHAEWSDIIKKEKKIKIVTHKTSGGTLDEGGLLWFALDFYVAERFAEGVETRKPVQKGEVFSFVTTKKMFFLNRYYKMNKEEAAAINDLLGIPDYKMVSKGDNINLAVGRAFSSSSKRHTMKRQGELLVMWPILFEYFGADGLTFGFDDQYSHFGIAAEEISVS